MQSLNDKRGDLGNKVVYFSWKQDCYEITQDHCEVFPQLSSDHEEADAKITSFLKFVNRRFGAQGKVIVRSPSGDIDIPVIILGTGLDAELQIYIDNSVGRHQKILDLNTSNLTMQQKQGLIGLHRERLCFWFFP